MLERIKDMVKSGKRFLITTHIDPDGDAIGSAFAMYWALETLGKSPLVYLKDQIPYNYEFLPQPKRVVYEIPDGEFDVIFVVDCGNLFRIGEGYEQLKDKGNIINIDHHTTNEPFGLINLIDENASSTAEILYRLLTLMNAPMTFEIAVNLYTAIFTDTGSFRYENTNSSAFLICEEMLRHGVEPFYVSKMVHENHPKERFLLLGLVLNTLETYDQGRIAIAHVTEEMFKKTNTTREHVDGFVEYIREIRGVEVAALVRETDNGKYKISMRSKGKVDVANVCTLFGGGGHKNAAGCNIDGTLEDVKTNIKEVVRFND